MVEKLTTWANNAVQEAKMQPSLIPFAYTQFKKNSSLILTKQNPARKQGLCTARRSQRVSRRCQALPNGRGSAWRSWRLGG